MSDRLIYGEDETERVVCVEPKDDAVEIFIEEEDGTIRTEERDYKHWMLSAVPLSKKSIELDGWLHYRFMNEYDNLADFSMYYAMTRRRGKRKDTWRPFNMKESYLIKHGTTYYKGLKHDEVSILSTDIETTGLKHNKDAMVILISNTFRKNGKVTKKLFAYDEYSSQAAMLKDWCNWVREMDPSIICGHNVYNFDFPYLQYVADRSGVKLNLGRDCSPINFMEKDRKFRIDGNNFLDFKSFFIYGREVVDTMFLAYKYDVATRKYPNYKLKSIIEFENLEKEDRQHYDAGEIRFKYKDPEEMKKIKQYAIDDADDALALYDLMSPALFYLTQSVPKPFQEIVCSATGSQVNSVLVRAYLQDGHSIPNASEKVQYGGAISYGSPGIYRNVFKVDVASLYPSIMIWGEVHDPEKDPKKYFLKIVKEFTRKRLEHKALKADPYYDGLQSAEKIFINSCYGFLGSGYSNFNFPEGAAYVTKMGRATLKKVITWATGGKIIPIKPEKKGDPKWAVVGDRKDKFKLVNCDTDSISICKNDMSEISEEERQKLVDDMNDLFPDEIVWEDDGYFKTMIVVKAKNYIMYDPTIKDEKKRIKYKGASIKASTKQPALKEFIKRILWEMLEGDGNYTEIYNEYVREIMDLQDINRWCTRKSVTEKVLNPKRKQEQKVLDAIEGSNLVEGDRAHFFYKSDDSLCLVENFDGDYHASRLLKSLHNTALIFKTVLPPEKYFLNYSLKRNQEALQKLTSEDESDNIAVGE